MIIHTPNMKKKYSKELVIGLSVIAMMLILIFGIDYLKGINVFKASNYYYASYTNVAGLAQSAPVTINGYKVGLVREINYEYDNPGHVKVEMSLDKKLRVPQGTKAVLVCDMLGTATIQLEMAHNNNFHNVGDMLIGETAPGLLDGVQKDVMPSLGSVMEKLDSLLSALNYIATNPALANAVNRLDDIMANVETSSANLDRTMKSMPSIASDAGVTMKNVTEISKNLHSISSDLSEVSAQLKSTPIDSTLNNVYQITESLGDMTRKLNSTNSSLGLLLNDRGLYDNLNGSAASLDSLLRDVKKNPKRYISIKLL